MSTLPRPNQVVALHKGKERPDIKPAIEQCFLVPDFLDKIEKYITNGVAEGHKLLDQRCILEIAIDTDKTGLIESSALNTKEKIDQMMVVVRRHYVLDKHARYVSVNPKRYALLASAQAAAVSEQAPA